MKKISNLHVTVAAVVAMGTSVAQASLVTETVTLSPSAAGLSGLTFEIPQFNPALGTLTGVSLSLTPTLGDFGYRILNASGSPQIAAFVSVGPLSGPFGGPTSGTLNDSGLGLNASWSSSQTLSAYNITAGPGFTSGTLPFSFTTTPSGTVAVSTVGFTGAGDYPLSVTGTSQFSVGGSPGYPLFYGDYGNVGGIVVADYTYTPVPEPTTIIAGVSMMLPFGASALRMLRKK